MKNALNLSLLIALALASKALSAAAVPAGPTEGDLLELKAAQAESLDSLDAVVESTISMEGGVSKTVRMRFGIDKTMNAIRIQSLAQPDLPALEMKMDGAQMSVRQGDGPWKTRPIEGSFKETLEGLGMDFSAAAIRQARTKLPLEAKARRLAKRQRIKDHVAQWRKAGRRERRTDLDGELGAAGTSTLDLKQPLAFEQDGLIGDANATPAARPRSRKARAVMTYFNEAKPGQAKAARKQAHDAVLELVDEDTGVTVETSRFVAAESLGEVMGIDEKAPASERGARRLPAWVKRMRGSDGRELVELQRQRVLKQALVHGVVVPVETESVEVTGAGVVEQKVKWTELKVNEGSFQ